MLTFRFTTENRVVADAPMLIFATSPMASFSASVNSVSSASGPSKDDAPASPADSSSPFKSALISSCDNIPSMLLFPLSDYRSDSHSIFVPAGTGKGGKFLDIAHIHCKILFDLGI